MLDTFKMMLIEQNYSDEEIDRMFWTLFKDEAHSNPSAICEALNALNRHRPDLAKHISQKIVVGYINALAAAN